MNRYRITSKFKDAKGRDLFQSKTFDGTAKDAKAALMEAHAEMARLGAADPRVDVISSIVKGPNEEISTTDYLDELDFGMSTNGLMREVAAEDLEPRRTPTVDPARDGFATGGIISNPTVKDKGLYGEGIAANRATGGPIGDAPDSIRKPSIYNVAGDMVYPFMPKRPQDFRSPNADTTPGRYDVAGDEIVEVNVTLPEFTEEQEIDFEGGFPYMPKAPKSIKTGDEIDLGPGNIYVNGRFQGRVKEFKIKVNEHETPPFQKSIKTVGDVIKASQGKPTLADMRRLVKTSQLEVPGGLGMTEIEKRDRTDHYEQLLSQGADEEETE